MFAGVGRPRHERAHGRKTPRATILPVGFTSCARKRILVSVMEKATTEAAHGTAGHYNNGGCRCRPCKTAWAEYIRTRARQRGRKACGSAYYAGHVDRAIGIRPTPIGLGILTAAEARTGLDRHDIVEHLLRSVGPRLAGDAEKGLRTCQD